MIIFLHGEDDFRIKRKLSEFKEKFKKDVDPTGEAIIHFDGEKLSLDALNTSVNSDSLFVRRRMVVVENVFLNKNKEIYSLLLDFVKKDKVNVENRQGESPLGERGSPGGEGDLGQESKNKDPKDGNILIFCDENIGLHPTKDRKNFWNHLIAGQFSQEFKKLSNTETSSWIKKEAKLMGAEISVQNSVELGVILENDLWKIKNELEKLINYKKGLKLLDGGKLEIEKQDIEKMTKGSFDDNIFALTEAIGAKNKSLAMALFEEQVQNGISVDYILTMIIWQFKRLLQVKQALDLGSNSRKIASDLKFHPFVVQKSINQVRNYDLDYLKIILKKLILLNKKSRETGSNVQIRLGLFITKF